MPTARSEDSDDCAPDDDTALSRTGFLRGGAAALAAGTVMTAGAASARPAPGKGGHEARRGVDPNPDYRRPRVTRLRTVTGPGITTRFRMDATDLGAPAVTPDGRILVVFGDTFEEAAVGGGWWRAPVGLYANPRQIGRASCRERV